MNWPDAEYDAEYDAALERIRELESDLAHCRAAGGMYKQLRDAAEKRTKELENELAADRGFQEAMAKLAEVRREVLLDAAEKVEAGRLALSEHITSGHGGERSRDDVSWAYAQVRDLLHSLAGGE